ncbi:MAG: adaptor protein MecA [Clostridia bacterium]|nr:adaptor protein MecA [Clostridia bacterium]
MKIERINNSKAKITLTLQELKKRKITLNDIKNNKAKAQDFFLELLEDASLLEEFETDSNELFIEANKENDLFTITITKISELSSTDIISNENTTYRINSNIYSFKNIYSLKDFAKKCYELGLYLPESIIYSFNNKLFLVFKKKKTCCSDFVKTFSVLSEYADTYYSSRSFNDILIEYGTLIFESKDLNHILEYPYFLT